MGNGEIFKRAIAEKRSFWVETTGSSTWIGENIAKQAQDAGFLVKVLYVITPLTEIVPRIFHREAETRHVHTDARYVVDSVPDIVKNIRTYGKLGFEVHF